MRVHMKARKSPLCAGCAANIVELLRHNESRCRLREGMLVRAKVNPQGNSNFDCAPTTLDYGALGVLIVLLLWAAIALQDKQ